MSVISDLIDQNVCLLARFPLGFSPADTHEVSGVAASRLSTWHQANLLPSGFESGRGHGNARRYTFEQVKLLSLAGLINDVGVPVKPAIKIAAQLLEALEGPALVAASPCLIVPHPVNRGDFVVEQMPDALRGHMRNKSCRIAIVFDYQRAYIDFWDRLNALAQKRLRKHPPCR